MPRLPARTQPPETRPAYYESWLTALEKLLDAKSILTQNVVNLRVRQIKRGLSKCAVPSRLPFGVLPWPDEEG